MNISRQRGAATLVVVMVLFFIISMVAAYTSRNMVFEQRTGANLYRATQSFEAAEAGMNWALMMLNSGRVDGQCLATTSPANDSFRERYLALDATTGLVTARLQPGGDALTPTCVFNGDTDTWSCSCPVDAPPSLTTPSGNATSPAFRIRFQSLTLPSSTPQPGLIRVDVVGCTRLDNACLDVAGASPANEGRTVSGAVVMLSGRATSYPQAALTARGAVTATSGLTVINAISAGSGVTVHASGSINTAGLALSTSAGNALSGSILPLDSGLDPPAIAASGSAPGFTAAERFFAGTFMLTPQRWVQMPGVVTVACPVGGCGAAAVRTAIANNPGRPLWLTGTLLADSVGDIGSATAPVMMVVNGNLEFSAANVTVHGLLMLRPVDPTVGWDIGASTQVGTIRGAVVVDGAVTRSGTGTGNVMTVQYDESVLTSLRTSSGTFFRVAGSWRDWVMP
jgi:Tfp pilus assembly protein PilX